MPDGETLVVANGGIETHPETGRTKLNLPTMRPNLSYVALSGAVIEKHEPASEWHRNSIRHLAISAIGQVALACQWQGNLASVPPLLATHRRGEALRFHAGEAGLERQMQGYAGSIAFSGDGLAIALTGPRGGAAAGFSAQGTPWQVRHHPDICGAAPAKGGFVFTSGNGDVLCMDGSNGLSVLARHALNWDNHLIRIPPV